ncbi:MAG: YhcH/YjgK/YiaL family protein, partial [Paludibacter sp.]
YMLYNDKPTCYLTIELGEFFIVYPEDAHAPLIGKGNIRKLIAKVKI